MRPQTRVLLLLLAAAAALPPAALVAGFAYRAAGGFIPAGGDVSSLPAGTTVAAAEAACDALLDACAGFTFVGPRAGPANGTVYLKNATAAADFEPDPASEWTTLLKAEGPCDILLAAGTPCVAAHSVARALYGAYAGPLFQVNRSRDGALLDVGTVADSGGVADGAAQAAFCAGGAADACVVSRIYDQSPMQNHLGIAASREGVPDSPVNATRFPAVVNGFPVWAAFFEGQMGYRNDTTSGMATGNAAQVIYYVVDGSHSNGGCCFDYGNAEVKVGDDGDGTMESIFFGSATGWTHGFGAGPWVGADLENGIYYGNETSNPGNMPIKYPFVFAMLKGGTDGFELKAADATQGKLMSMFAGTRPGNNASGLGPYQPMQKQGAIILGIGGDNTRVGVGTFYEGVIAQGYTTDAVDDALQRNVVAAGYGVTST